MRVAIPLEGHRIGGSHVSAMTMVDALNLHTTVDARLVLGTEGPLSALLEQSDTTYHLRSTFAAGKPLTPYRFAAAILIDTPRMARFLRENQITILHTGDSAMHVTWGVAGRALGLPHVWHQRGTKWPKKMPVDPKAIDVIAISEFVMKSLPTLPFRSKRIIDNPIAVPPRHHQETGGASARLRETLGLGNSTRIVGFVANLIAYKRPEFFLEVASQLLRLEPDLHFVMAGREHDYSIDRLRQTASHYGIEKHVSFIGFVTNVLEFIAALDMIIVTAVDEPFGRTIPEAMLLGTPFVASDSGGHSESLPEPISDRLADPDNPMDFALKAQRLLEGNSVQTFETAQLETYASERFSGIRHASAVEEVYRDR